jgi:hypothetical protein
MTQRKFKSRSAVLIVAVGTAAGLAGCASGDGDAAAATSAEPTWSTSGHPEHDLPMPLAEIPGWAALTVATTGDAGYVSGSSGWLSQRTSPHLTSTDTSLPPGDYDVTVACHGESSLDVALLSVDDTALAATTVECDETPVALAISSAGTGLRTDLVLAGSPVVYAISVQLHAA